MIRIALAGTMLAMAAPALAQTQPSAQQPLVAPMGGGWPDAIEDRENAPVAKSRARFVAQQAGTCVADKSPAKSGDVLMLEPGSSRYRAAVKSLTEANAYCFGARGKPRDSNLMFLGALAERVLAQDPAPLNARLARAAGGAEMVTFGPAERITACVARSAPDDVAALLATKLASAEEKAAADKLTVVLGACARGGQPLSANIDALRAAIAVAAFRSIQTSPALVAGN